MPLRATVCLSMGVVNHFSPPSWAIRAPIRGPRSPGPDHGAAPGRRLTASRDRGPRRPARPAPRTRAAALRQVAEEGGEEVVEGDADAGGDLGRARLAGTSTQQRRPAPPGPSGRGPRTGSGRRRGCGAGRCRRPSCRPTVTSPGPRPAKHTAADHGVRTSGPLWTSPSTPSSASAAAQTSPSQWKARPTSSSHKRVAGRDDDVDPEHLARDDQHRSPAAAPSHDLDVDAGSHVRRRAARCRAPGPGPSASATHTARSAGSGTSSAWNSAALRERRSNRASSRADSVAGWR